MQVCRLFDLFLATHPLMPLYVGAAAMHSQRQQLLAAEEMPILHSKLVNLSVTRMATADQLAIQVRRGIVCNGRHMCSFKVGHMWASTAVRQSWPEQHPTAGMVLTVLGVFVTREHVRHNKSGIAHRGRARINH
jgi:hypothetical protein